MGIIVFIDRILTALGFTAALCAAIGISVCPSEFWATNVLVYVVSGLMALKEIGDFRKIRRAELAAAQFMEKMSNKNQEEDK